MVFSGTVTREIVKRNNTSGGLRDQSKTNFVLLTLTSSVHTFADSFNGSRVLTLSSVLSEGFHS